MTYKLELTIHELPTRYNQGMGAHWTQRHTESKKWVSLIGREIFVHTKPKEPLKSAMLTLTRHSSVAPDYDGLVQSFKPVVDALKKLGIISDDSMKVIGKPTYGWEKAKPKEGFITITVEERGEQL